MSDTGAPRTVVVMGVCGTGKTIVDRALRHLRADLERGGHPSTGQAVSSA